MFAQKLLVATGLVFGLTACSVDVQGTLTELENSTLDSAFEGIRDAAEQNGGAAVRLRQGQEATMEVTNQDSDLFGAKVVIPANALPADVEHAAATIQGAGAAPTVQADDLKVSGPFAVVAIMQLPLGGAVELQENITITLPFSQDTSYPTEQLVLGAFADEVSAVTGSTSDETTVTGDTKDLDKVFAAVWEVDYNGEAVEPGQFAYKVVKNEDVICVGLQEDAFSEGDTFIDAGPVTKISLLVGGLSTVEFETGAVGAADSQIPKSIPAGSVSVTCNGVTYTNGSTSGLNIVSYVESSSAVASCNSANDCTESIGTINIAGFMTFTATSGETVKVGIDTTVTDFSWLYY